jgi:FKBP-type peptidyl-prolyl cis-trans isomerase (trigger factor)
MEIKTEIKKLDKSRVEIDAEIDAATFSSYEQKALAHLGEHAEIPGFRKGHVPENILTQHVPEIRVLEEMAELAVADAFGTIIEKEKVDAIGRPEISLTKLAKGNPLAFKIVTAVVPQVTLPDYKKIAAETPMETAVEVTDEDVEKTVAEVRTMRARKENPAADPETKAEIKTDDLPPLDDAYVQTLGSFNDVEDFKVKLRENLRLEKDHQIKEKRRLKIIEALIEKSSIDVPDVIVQAELDKMIHRLKGDIENIGFEFEAYLKQVQKTEADIRTEWESEAAKRAKLQLVVQKIADVEKIVPDEKDVEHELAHLIEHYKDADPMRARLYIQSSLTTEKVFRFLEEAGEAGK